MVNSIKDAIERLYIGKCTITEHQQFFDTTTKQTKFCDVDIFTDIPCRLSFSSLRVTSDEAVSSVTQSIKLFLAPDIKIPAGCKITVTQNNRTTSYKQSSTPAVHSNHQEIQLELFQKWA